MRHAINILAVQRGARMAVAAWLACMTTLPTLTRAQSAYEQCDALDTLDRRARAACVREVRQEQQAVRREERMARQQAQAQARRPPPVRPLPAAAAPETPAAGPYSAQAFKGLKEWRQAFEKAAQKPQEFAAMRAEMEKDIRSIEGQAQSLVAPKRVYQQKFLTDYDLFRLYHRPDILLTKQDQCLQPRDYAPEEACDCMAGFPGDTSIGPGAGELITQSNHTAAIKACGFAAAHASDAARKARYTAQQARAQLYTMDAAAAMTLADAAIAAGYRRATIVKAEGPLWDIEIRAGGFPPMTLQAFREEMEAATDNLHAARKAGVKEAYLVSRKYQQLIAHLQFNEDVRRAYAKAIGSDIP